METTGLSIDTGLGIAAALTAVLAILHLAAPRIRHLPFVPERNMSSFAGGLAVAYVFLHLLPELAAKLKNLPTFDAPGIKQMFHDYAEEKGLKMGKVMPPVRAAVAGTMESPDLPDMLAALGRERVVKRVEEAVK